MNETTELTDLIPKSERIENIPPFEVGDYVQMRSKALQLIRFHKYEKDDIGIVLELKKGNTEWLVNVHWQRFIPKGGKSIVKHTRLKKLRIKKDVP